MPSPRARLPLLAALVVLIARLPLLLSLQDSHYAFEVYSGSVAAGLLDGLDLHWPTLTVVSHVRGGPLFGVLAAPLMALLGPTLLVVKLVPLLWHAATVALLVAAAERLLDRRAALATAALLVCAPPLLAKLSVMVFASHLEAMLPLAAALLVAAPLLDAERRPQGPPEPRSRPRSERRSAAGRCLALGALAGFAGFFHLQALLGMALLFALLLWVAPRVVLRGAPWLLLGAAALAAPSWIFEGGSLTLLGGDASLTAGVSQALIAPGPLGETAVFGVPDKLRALVSQGLGPVLEFGDLGGLGLSAGRVAAHLCATLLLLACALGLLGLRALLRWPPLRGQGPQALLLFWPLLALGLGAAFFASGMPWDLWCAGTGMEGRRLAPVLLALSVTAAMAVSAESPRLRRTGTLIVTALCATGLLGQAPLLLEAGSRSTTNRGESNEWFLGQLDRHAGGDLDALLSTLGTTDRGDARFRGLRFRIARLLNRAQQKPAETLTAARQLDPGWRRDLMLVHVGRGLAGDSALATNLPRLPWLAKLAPEERAALLHGVGLGLERRQPAARPRVDVLDPRIAQLARQLPPELAEPVMEGLGFGAGQLHDPYNRLMAQELPSWAELPGPCAAAFFRGLGWGYRQRFAAEPDEPLALRLFDDVPQAMREHLLDGLLLRRLPLELGG